MCSCIEVQKELKAHANKEKAKILSRFFKTGKGEYGEGDQFLGITVPTLRKVASSFKKLPITEIKKLLYSPIHEERFFAVITLVNQFKKEKELREDIFHFYVKNLRQVNNWDLIDVSAKDIIGATLFEKKRDLLYQLCLSKNLWERRAAIVSTHYFIKRDDFNDIFSLTLKMQKDPHDLIHKALGWMLREVGKKGPHGREKLLHFLNDMAPLLPRVTLRYAIEHLSPKQRIYFLSKKLC